jgi:putative PEP-CTERM system TPR-repeat lipoprotein
MIWLVVRNGFGDRFGSHEILSTMTTECVAPNGRRVGSTCVLVAVGLLGLTACSRDPVKAAQRYVASGDAYASAGKYAEAIIQYRNAIQKDPRSSDARLKLAEMSLRVRDGATAVEEYIRAADLRPDDVALQLKTSRLLLLAGRFDDAKSRAEKILARDSKNVDAQIVIANALAEQKDLDAAVEQIEEALKLDPERSLTYTNLGALELGRGKRDAAERAFKRAVDLEPRSITANLALSNFYWLVNETAAAEASFKQTLSIDPHNVAGNRLFANFYLSTNRRDAAEPYLKTVFEVDKSPSSALMLADYYSATGKSAAAEAILQPMLKDPRTTVPASVRLAAIDHQQGRRDDAYRRLTTVLASHEGNQEALLLKTALLLSDKRLDEALATAKTATERDRNSAQAFFALGRVQMARNQADAAIAAFQEVVRLNPRASSAKLALAQLHFGGGRPEESLAFAQETLAAEPSNADARLLVARGLLARGDLDRATVELKQLSSRFPNSPAVHTTMGMLLGRKKEFAAARTEFERALKLEPKYVEAFQGLVTTDLATRDFAAARTRVDNRVASEPTAPVLTIAGLTYAMTADSEGAERLLRRAIETDSTYVAAYAALGRVYISQHKLGAARQEFDALVERSPKPVAALTMAGMILQAEGNINLARERFERALKIDPEAAVAANNLAWIYAERGDNLDIALELAETAHKRLPEVPEVNDTLGYVYYQKNMTSLAISTFKATTERSGNNPVYWYHLGLAYARGQDTEHAREALTKALELKPDFDGAQHARELLQSLSAHSENR